MSSVFETARSLVLAAAFAVGAGSAALAQETFPSKPITVIIPYGPGGGGDTYSRLIQPYLERELGVTLVVENIPGAGGIVGQTAAFNRPADGYTIVLWSTPSNELNSITSDTPFENADWEGLGAAAPGQTIVAVPADRPWTTLGELVEDLKAKPDTYSFGGIGPFGTGGIAYAKMQRALGFSQRWVPFAGTAEVNTALLGGHVDVALVGGGEANFADLAQSGKIKILAVLADEPAGPYADMKLPTAESAIGIPIVHQVQRGHVVRAGTPPDRLAILRDAYRKAATDPEFQKQVMERMGPYQFIDGEGLSRILHEGSAELEALMPVLNEMAGN